MTSMAAPRSFDVVVVGAGIIGLTIARQFLLCSDLSVAIVDASLPCSGATGAGQGNIWMNYKKPGSDIWMKTGSLLVGTNEKDSNTLKNHMKQLLSAGLQAQYLSHDDLVKKEPELLVRPKGSAVFLPDDVQIDARRTAHWIEKGNRQFMSKGRYAEFYGDPAIGLLRSGKNDNVYGVRTQKNTLYSKKAIIVATGCWTGSLMDELVGKSNIKVNVPVKPRRGYLLQVKNFGSFKLNHGVMEVGYTNHISPESIPSSSSSSVVNTSPDSLSISMTATMDDNGNLLFGSSRQFVGFNTEVDMRIVDGIWNRAGDFFPTLTKLPLADVVKRRQVRVGLRPYVPAGKPIIGPIPSIPNVFVSTGHEGEGLSMALGTAELIVDMVMGNPMKIDHKPFAVEKIILNSCL